MPSAAHVRGIRPFKMTDPELEHYIILADSVETNTAIPAASRQSMWALLAAHLATVMQEPEAASVRIGPLQTSWQTASSGDALDGSAPGREYKRRMHSYGRGHVLR